MFLQTSCYLLTLLSTPSIAGFAARTEQSSADDVDWTYLRAVDKMGNDSRVFNDYIQVAYDTDYDGVDYYYYFITYPGALGNQSTVDPFPKGNLRLYGDKGYGYLFPMDTFDDDGLGLYDVRFGKAPPGPATKRGGFYAEPCSGRLVYDDTPGNDHFNGTFAAKRRRYVDDGSAYIRWFNGNGPLPDDYYEVELIRDSTISCEAMRCDRHQPELCAVDGCKWEDTWEKQPGC